jgi:hypothetical protein
LAPRTGQIRAQVSGSSNPLRRANIDPESVAKRSPFFVWLDFFFFVDIPPAMTAKEMAKTFKREYFYKIKVYF